MIKVCRAEGGVVSLDRNKNLPAGVPVAPPPAQTNTETGYVRNLVILVIIYFFHKQNVTEPFRKTREQ